MRLSDILVYLNVDSLLLPFILDYIPGVSRDGSVNFYLDTGIILVNG